jgi:hypothetical protein
MFHATRRQKYVWKHSIKSSNIFEPSRPQILYRTLFASQFRYFTCRFWWTYYRLKRHGGWRSGTIAEGYIEDNIQNKLKIVEKIQGKRQHEKTVVPSTSSAFSNDYTEEPEDKKSKGVSILQTNAELNIQNRQNQIFSEKINLPSIVINSCNNAKVEVNFSFN